MKENQANGSLTMVGIISANHPAASVYSLIYTERSNRSQFNDHPNRSRDSRFHFSARIGSFQSPSTFFRWQHLIQLVFKYLIVDAIINSHVTSGRTCAFLSSPTSKTVHYVGRGCPPSLHGTRCTTTAFGFFC